MYGVIRSIMVYLIPLTVREAAFTGAVGCACLCMSYVLANVAQRVNKINRSNSEALTTTSIKNNENSIANRITSKLNIYIEKVAASVSTIIVLLPCCLAFLLWQAGTAAITFAAIGPLLV